MAENLPPRGPEPIGIAVRRDQERHPLVPGGNVAFGMVVSTTKQRLAGGGHLGFGVEAGAASLVDGLPEGVRSQQEWTDERLGPKEEKHHALGVVCGNLSEAL